MRSIWTRRGLVFFAAIAVVLGMFGASYAANVTLTWNPNPPAEQVTAYTVYERVGTASPVQRWTGAATTATLTNVTPGIHTYFVTAKNLWAESGPSVDVSTPGSASAPTGVVVTVTVTVTVPVQ